MGEIAGVARGKDEFASELREFPGIANLHAEQRVLVGIVSLEQVTARRREKGFERLTLTPCRTWVGTTRWWYAARPLKNGP